MRVWTTSTFSCFGKMVSPMPALSAKRRWRFTADAVIAVNIMRSDGLSLLFE